MHYAPSEGPAATGFWCPSITLTVDDCRLHLILGEAYGTVLALSPPANNVAVLFPPHDRRAWADSPRP